MAMKLYVGGLEYGVTDQELSDLFATEGKVVSATVIKDKYSGQSKGFGFVEMEDLKEGQKAIKSLDGKELNGRAIRVSEARPQEDRRSGGGGNNRNFGGGGNNNRRRY